MKPSMHSGLNAYSSVVHWFIPSRLLENQRDLTMAQNIVTLSFLVAVCVPLIALLYLCLNFAQAAAAVLLGGSVIFCSSFVLKFTGRISLARETYICSFYGLKVWLACHLGGIEAPTLPWFLLCPMLAMLLGGARPGIIWGAISSITVFGIFYLQKNGMQFPPNPVSDPHLLQVVSILGLFVLSAILLVFFETGKSHGFARRKGVANQAEALAEAESNASNDAVPDARLAG